MHDTMLLRNIVTFIHFINFVIYPSLKRRVNVT